MRARVERLALPRGRRIIAASDIHGNLDLLRAMLIGVGLSGGDELFLIGDYVARGPHSLGTVRFLMELVRESPTNIHLTMGNMECWHLENLLSQNPARHSRILGYSLWQQSYREHSFLGEMLAEMGEGMSESTDLTSLLPHLRSHFAPELEFLAGLPTIIETDHLIFVHGGIPAGDAARHDGRPAMPLLKFDNFVNAGYVFEKHLLTGHTPTTNYHEKPSFLPHYSRRQRIISLDGGCGVYAEGQLNAFILPDERDMHYTVKAFDALPAYTAQGAQTESRDYTNLRFIDAAVRIIERDEAAERAFVEQLSTGRTLWVPSGAIRVVEGEALCVYTDYRPAVRPGDRVRLIKTTAEGHYIKTGGLCGWYDGKLENGK